MNLSRWPPSTIAKSASSRLMPYGEGAAIYDEEYLSGDEALESLQQSFEYLGPAPDSATAARYRFVVEGRERTVGFITTVSHPFCDRCDRLRLDSHGRRPTPA